METSLFVVPFIVGALTQALVAWGLFAWARSLTVKHRGAWWRRTTWMPLAALALNVIGIAISSAMLLKALGSLGAVAPASRQELLARGISEAMNITALTVIPAWTLYATSLVSCIVGAIRPASSA